MKSKLWRVPAQGLSFLLLGVGGFFIATFHTLIVLPIPIKQSAKQAFTRKSIRGAFYCYVRILEVLGLLHFNIKNKEQLAQSKGQIIIANHPTLLDVVFLMSVVRNANCVVKSTLWKTPLTAAPVRAAGYIKNDDKALLDSCLQSLKDGDNLIIFPEGTRTVPGKPMKFQRGLAYLALESNALIQPITIDCTPPTLLKGSPWYEVPDEIPHFRLWVDPTITISDAYETQLPRSKQVRQICRHLQSYFTNRLEEESKKLKNMTKMVKSNDLP